MEVADTAEKRVSLREIVFYLYFTIMFGMRMWGIYEGKPIYGPLLIVGFCLWGISILMNEYTLIEYSVIVAFMVLAAVVYLRTGEKGLLLYFSLMLGMKGISVKRLFKVGIFAGMSGLICLTFLSAFGIIEDVAYIQTRHFVGEVFRRSLGFPHPNTLSSSFTILAIMIMYLIGYENKRKALAVSAIMAVIAIYLYLYSGSRTGIMMTFGYLGLNIIYMYRNKIGVIEKVALMFLFPIIWLLSIIGPALADEQTIAFVRIIDYNLGSRWEVGSYYWNNNHISLFGYRLANPNKSPYCIDLSQLNLLLQLGLVAFIVITVLWFALLYDEMKYERISELVITFSLLVMGVMDPFLYNISFKNVAFCFMGVWLFKALKHFAEQRNRSFQSKILVLKIGEKQIGLPPIKNMMLKDLKSRKICLVSATMIITILAAAVLYYFVTPDPKYALSDRGYGEHKEQSNFNLIGRTYTNDEIAGIRGEGNIVIDYTDENELMYTYYSDEENAIEGGYYAPNAALMEKIRISLSIFFWGSWCAVLLVYLFELWRKNEKQS